MIYRETGFNPDECLRQFINEFRDTRPHIHIDQVSVQLIRDFVKQDYVVQADRNKKLSLLEDYMLAQGLCDVSE
jgi:hypothetical protein